MLQGFEGAAIRFGDVQDLESLRNVAFSEPVDVVVSCLASRTGGKVSSCDCVYAPVWALALGFSLGASKHPVNYCPAFLPPCSFQLSIRGHLIPAASNCQWRCAVDVHENITCMAADSIGT